MLRDAYKKCAKTCQNPLHHYGNISEAEQSALRLKHARGPLAGTPCRREVAVALRFPAYCATEQSMPLGCPLHPRTFYHTHGGCIPKGREVSRDIQSLWSRYRTNGCRAARQELIAAYAPLAKQVVDSLRPRRSAPVDYEDMIGAALIGLIDAIDRYDPERGVQFQTYATWRVRGAVLDMLRSMDWVPRSIRHKGADLQQAYDRLEGELGRPATDDEVAQALGVTRDELDRCLEEVAPVAVLSLEETLAGGNGDENLTLADSLADPRAVAPDNHAERQDLLRLLAHAIESLPEQERIVITLYYYEALTLKEIGRVMNVTESRACQVHTKAILRLQARMRACLAPA